MKTTLIYTHSRNLFSGSDFKPFVNKYFKDVEFEGFEVGNWYPAITISNWEEVKNILPKSYMPCAIEICGAKIQLIK